MFRPKSIMIIRHGEKPGSVMIDSEDEGIHLSTKGHSRAEAIKHQGYTLFGTEPIDYVFACKKSKASNRALETIKPYATLHNLKINNKFEDIEIDKLVAKLFSKKYHDKKIIVAWHHGMIPKLIEALDSNAEVYPIKRKQYKLLWDENVFDVVLTVEYPNVGRKGVTTSTPQQLLFGDVSQVPTSY